MTIAPATRECWPADRLCELSERWRHGQSARAIATAMGCAVSSVRLRARRYGFERDLVPARIVYHPPLGRASLLAIRQHFESGVPTRAICAEVGVSSCRVYHLAKQGGWKRPAGWRLAQQSAARFDPTADQETWLRLRWAENVPLRDLADHLRVSINTVRRLAQRLALPARDRNAVLRAAHDHDPRIVASRLKAKRIVRLYNAGLRTDEIAALEGRTTEAIGCVLGRARKQGQAVRYGCRPLVVNGAAGSVIRDGYRLGIGLTTLVQLLDPGEGWTSKRVHYAAKVMGLRHRNAGDPVRARLAPEHLLREQIEGRDPIDRVQASYRRHPSLSEASALEALAAFQEAWTRFPRLEEVSPPRRKLRPTPFRRSPSAVIEARRGRMALRQHSDRAIV